MFAILSIMFAGILCGYLLRRVGYTIPARAVTALVWLLLFLLGVEVGCDDRIIHGLATLGLRATLISVAAVLGSCAMSLLLYLMPGNQSSGTTSRQRVPLWSALRGSMVIIAFCIVGIAVGLARVFDIAQFNESNFNISFVALASLMFCVGAGIGGDLSVFSKLRQFHKAFLLLPLATVTGTLAGAAAVSLLVTGYTLPDTLSIASGFGYYSLSGILITDMRGAELGTVALLCNIIREVLTLLCAPLMARCFSPLAPISSGGATSMDTTLPVITMVSGKEYVILSIYHGFIVDFSVPFLVTFFCSMA